MRFKHIFLTIVLTLNANTSYSTECIDTFIDYSNEKVLKVSDIISNNVKSYVNYLNNYIGVNKIIRLSNPYLTDDKIIEYNDTIMRCSKEYELHPCLIASVIHIESRFKENSFYIGNYGPMQVNWTAHKNNLIKMGITKDDLKTIDCGVQYGCIVLKECLRLSKGNVRNALYRYNGSHNVSYADTVIKMFDYGKNINIININIIK